MHIQEVLNNFPSIDSKERATFKGKNLLPEGNIGATLIGKNLVLEGKIGATLIGKNLVPEGANSFL